MRNARKIPLDDFEDLARSYGHRAGPDARVCEAPECNEPGDYRAPKSPDRLNDFYWFCLKHVQAYNKSWNYYAGMSEDEVEAHTRRDTTWQRPTWRFGDRGSAGPNGQAYSRPWDHVADDYRVLDDEGPTHEYAKTRREKTGAPNLPPQYARALETLELPAPVDLATLKGHYKALVKRYHPDANGGDPAAEERLKAINEAYAAVKKRLGG